MVVPVIDGVLKLLQERGCCDLDEIAGRFGLAEFEVKTLISFLVKYDFVDLDEGQRRAKLTSRQLKFHKAIGRIERKEALT